MDPLALGLFAAAVVALSLTPGPDLFLILGRGIAQGRAAALFTALGFFLAGFVQVPLLAFGLATLVADHPMAFDVLKYAGGAYLVWRGIGMIRNAGASPMPSGTSASAVAAMREGFIASLVNPKSHIFLLAFLPQFVRPEAGSVMLQFVVLGLIMRFVALAVEGALALAAGSIGQRLRRLPRLAAWLERAAGTLLVAVGLRLVLSGRPENAILRS